MKDLILRQVASKFTTAAAPGLLQPWMVSVLSAASSFLSFLFVVAETPLKTQEQ